MIHRKNAPIMFVFDLDNTLIMTDDANNLAYADAVQTVVGVKPQLATSTRYTRNDLRTSFPQLTDDQFDRIIETKQGLFGSYIDKTVLNVNLARILRMLSQNGNETILLTSCHRKRAIQLCKHYDIHQFFSHHYYYEDCQYDKYSFLRSEGFDLQSVVLFENDQISSNEAVQKGIVKDNIIMVSF